MSATMKTALKKQQQQRANQWGLTQKQFNLVEQYNKNVFIIRLVASSRQSGT